MFKPGLNKLQILIGLGSNCENALATLRQALRSIASDPNFKFVTLSALYCSDALLPEGAPAEWNIPFLNAAAVFEWTPYFETTEIAEIALTLLKKLKAIEVKLGRKPSARWAPRVIDLDILDWSLAPITLPDTIEIPHRELLNRPFALLPAFDLVGTISKMNVVQPHHEHACHLSRKWRFSLPNNVPLGTKRALAHWPELMGILNVTPDSFSGDSFAPQARFTEKLILRANEHLDKGATLLDIGAESTRPNATFVGPKEEIQRLAPALVALNALKSKRPFLLSLDTRHAETAAWALEHFKIDWLNNVDGFKNQDYFKLITEHPSVVCVAMHSLHVPPTGQTIPTEIDPIQTLGVWATQTRERFLAAGVGVDRLILDPGIGFGKTPMQNFEILARASELLEYYPRWLIGHSRKRFLDSSQSVDATKRDLETALATSKLALSGIEYLRVHDPESQSRALLYGH